MAHKKIQNMQKQQHDKPQQRNNEHNGKVNTAERDPNKDREMTLGHDGLKPGPYDVSEIDPGDDEGTTESRQKTTGGKEGMKQ